MYHHDANPVDNTGLCYRCKQNYYDFQLLRRRIDGTLIRLCPECAGYDRDRPGGDEDEREVEAR